MNQRADYIIPECYIDTNLVETLVCHSGCNHQKGCTQNRDVRFKQLFAALDSHIEFGLFKSLLTYLTANHYATTEEGLKAIASQLGFEI